MLCCLKCMPVKGLDFSFVAEPSQQQFAVPIFRKKRQGVSTCPPTKKPYLQRLWKINSVVNFSHFPHWLFALLFCERNEVTPLQGRFWRTVPDLVPRNACRAQKATMVQDQPHGAHMLLSELTLARGSSMGAIQSGTPSVTMPHLIPSFLNINSSILKNSQWDIHHNFTLLFLKNRYTALSCTTSNRKYFQFVGT